ncbi:unnamed protein product [Schistosoma margrebowiei]|uniref:Uncharacterized protein n=1 Tax=Schistosoma margrebowiei TaxID=48269 RepID=A0A183MFK2_9TREM|nr:unnamed protein product [Schistosoma margrebowiei]
MKTSTSEGRHGIQWTAGNQLDDLDFADDLAHLSRTHEQMQMKTASVAAVSASVGLSIHKGKTKVLKFKAEKNNPVTLDGETLENVESFTYVTSSPAFVVACAIEEPDHLRSLDCPAASYLSTVSDAFPQILTSS